MGRSPRGMDLSRSVLGPRRSIATVTKVAMLVAVGVLFLWNLSMLSQLSERVRPDQRLRAETPSIAMLGQATDSADDAPKEKPWFLQPETYEKSDGCDFSTAVTLFKPEELEINCDNIDELLLDENIGSGYWREVYKANWKGRDIAVKVVKESLMDRPDIIPRHVEESAAIFPIRNDPNIVSLIGWCESTVVVDYIPHQLDTLLFESEEPVSVRRALELARDAAHGVAQLHNVPGGPFVHADLQPRQFLIDANGTLKLNDFNRIKYTGPQHLNGEPTGEKCTFRTSVAKGKWRAPEEYKFVDLDEKLDIYSLSLVLWSLRSRVKPYYDYERKDVYVEVPEGLRPPIEAMSDYPPAMQNLIIRGWDSDPAERPSAIEMADEIDRILKEEIGSV